MTFKVSKSICSSVEYIVYYLCAIHTGNVCLSWIKNGLNLPVIIFIIIIIKLSFSATQSFLFSELNSPAWLFLLIHKFWGKWYLFGEGICWKKSNRLLGDIFLQPAGGIRQSIWAISIPVFYSSSSMPTPV